MSEVFEDNLSNENGEEVIASPISLPSDEEAVQALETMGIDPSGPDAMNANHLMAGIGKFKEKDYLNGGLHTLRAVLGFLLDNK